MNLPRLSDAELPALPKQAVLYNTRDRFDDPMAITGHTSEQMMAAMRAAAEAQRLKDEQWMREQKPVARVNNDGFIVEIDDVLISSGTKLYTAPVPASQGYGEVLNKLREKVNAMESLFDGIEAHRDQHRATATEGINTANEALVLLDALAAPVTTKEKSMDIDITLNSEQCKCLWDAMGEDRNDLSAIRIQIGEGHSGHGLYVSSAEYPEDGAFFVCPLTTKEAEG